MTPPDSVIHKARLTPIASLKPHPRNYRGHPEEQLAHIEQSIREHGFYRNVVVSSDGFILAGHGVVEAAQRMGMDKVPATHMPIPHDHPAALKILAADNEIGRFAVIDDAELLEILKTVSEDVSGLLGTGYSDDDLDDLIASLQERPPGTNVRRDDEVNAVVLARYGESAVRGVVLDYQLAQFRWISEQLAALREKWRIDSNSDVVRVLIENESGEQCPPNDD